MSSLHALLSQQTPHLQTRKALILLGLQNDFVSPDGKLPVNDTGYLDRIANLVPAFREFGDVIWIRTEYQANRPVDGSSTPGDTVIVDQFSDVENDDDDASAKRSASKGKRASPSPAKRRKSSSPRSSASFKKPNPGDNDQELFLSRTAEREPCCLRGTSGAEFADRVKPLIMPKKDLQIITSHYSAFGATSLLLTLRSKLITKLYVCGNTTDLSVYATAVDAARYGISITLVRDCLGFRTQRRHDYAMKQLHDLMEADIVTSSETLEHLRNPPVDESSTDEEDEAEGDEEDDDDDDESESETEQAYDRVQPRAYVKQPICDAATQQAHEAALEVDSDDSGEEMTLFSARGNVALRAKLELRSSSGKDSQHTANPRFATAPSLRPSSSRSEQPHENSVKKPTQQTSHRDLSDRALSRPQASSHQRKLVTADSPDSSERSRQPWLNLLQVTSATEAHTVLRPKHRGLAALSAVGGLDANTTAEYEAMMKTAWEGHQHQSQRRPLFGIDKGKESDRSQILHDLLPDDDAGEIFSDLNKEVNWQKMFHQTGEVPRLVCCQGTIGDDGSMPIYRHPSDQTIPITTWTPVVDRVRRAAEQAVGHPLNHALIQLYRGGNDYISEHSDKTLDITAGTNIVNVSFGAQRTMRLRTKRNAAPAEGARTTYRVPMPHNSMLIMSLPTNAEFLHGINWDRRPACELNEAEKAYGGHRISLTFRNIGTFLNKESTKIWGQGAVGKTQDLARPVVNGDVEQSEKLVRAFGKENQASSIVWDEIYGQGFDVLHLK